MKLLAHMDVEKTVSAFNLQIELSKLKISIPFNELLRNREYRDKITNMVKSQKKVQPDNHAIYDVDTDLQFFIFFNDGLPCDPGILVPIEVKEDEEFEKRQEVLGK